MAAVEQSGTEVLSSDTNADGFSYTSCYCEENMYMLCKALREQSVAAPDLSDLFVVFISNEIQQIPIWRQRSSSTGSEGFCAWDYHVICIQTTQGPDGALVWDLDTTLSLPVPFNSYVKEALRPHLQFDRMYSRLFRVTRADVFLRSFASDRRHMRTSEGQWRASPPPYDCIKSEDGEAHNLAEYNTIVEEQVQLTVDEDFEKLATEKYGVVVSEEGLRKAFSGLHN